MFTVQSDFIFGEGFFLKFILVLQIICHILILIRLFM